jgi:type I restriction enzyme, R subunit
LLAHGWYAIPREEYDKTRALFPKVALDFIRQTHQKKWEKLHGDKTGEVVLNDLAKMLVCCNS